jgi:hypothetical protein
MGGRTLSSENPRQVHAVPSLRRERKYQTAVAPAPTATATITNTGSAELPPPESPIFDDC